jgi:excisionase family DNA binding protein
MAQTIDGIEYVTADEAAELLATTPMRVLMLMRDKSLVGMEVGGEWLVSRESVACCEAGGTGMKEVRGCASCSGGCGRT